jgi:hypothetical protein
LIEYARRYAWIGSNDALEVYLNWPRAQSPARPAGLGLVARLVGRITTGRGGTCARRRHSLRARLAGRRFRGNAATFRSGFHWDSMRYVAIVLLLGWSALGVLVNAGASAGHWRILAATVIAAVGVMTSGAHWLTLPLAATALVGAVVWARLPGFATASVPVRALAAGAGVMAATAILVWSHDAKATASRVAFYGDPLFGAAAAVLDRQPDGTRLAVFGDQWIYPAFGDRLHLWPVRLDREGRTLPIADAMEPDRTVTRPPPVPARCGGVGSSWSPAHPGSRPLPDPARRAEATAAHFSIATRSGHLAPRRRGTAAACAGRAGRALASGAECGLQLLDHLLLSSGHGAHPEEASAGLGDAGALTSPARNRDLLGGHLSQCLDHVIRGQEPRLGLVIDQLSGAVLGRAVAMPDFSARSTMAAFPPVERPSAQATSTSGITARAPTISGRMPSSRSLSRIAGFVMPDAFPRASREASFSFSSRSRCTSRSSSRRKNSSSSVRIRSL